MPLLRESFAAARRHASNASSNKARETEMTNALYQNSVPVFTRTLRNLSAMLDKAAAHCEAKKIDPAVLINARLAPDMFPLSRQVQIACDTAKRAAGLLAGIDVPKQEDTEQTFTQLKERIDSTIRYMASVRPEQMNDKENAEITLPLRQPVVMKGGPLLRGFSIPNFYFHVTATYAILRHNGVEIGKRDFLGAFETVEERAPAPA
jgi:hypothetical protein